MISLTACKDNAKNLDMQAERQEKTFRFRFFPLPLAHPELRPGTLRIVPPPSRLSVVARHVGFRVPTHGGRAPQVRSGTGRKRSHAVRRGPVLGAVTFLALQDGGVSHLFATFAIRTII